MVELPNRAYLHTRIVLAAGKGFPQAVVPLDVVEESIQQTVAHIQEALGGFPNISGASLGPGWSEPADSAGQ